MLGSLSFKSVIHSDIDLPLTFSGLRLAGGSFFSGCAQAGKDSSMTITAAKEASNTSRVLSLLEAFERRMTIPVSGYLLPPFRVTSRPSAGQ